MLFKRNSKAFFKYVSGKEQVSTSVGPLRNRTGRVVRDEREMAGLLDRYFASILTQEQSGELPIAESIYQGGEEWAFTEDPGWSGGSKGTAR